MLMMQVHIVYMGALPESQYSLTSHHINILEEVVEESNATESLVHSYKRSFNGFAAKLNDRERQKLARKEGVVSVFPSRSLQLQTTRSWDFMGLTETVKRVPEVEGDVIIGVIDSGIWPESESFSDEGFGPPPKKWKGACNGGKNFTCNNKLIGARTYTDLGPDNTARDTVGHGSHTASTAAGNKVKDAGFYGLAQGNARGGVPSARIAAYKVCAEGGCSDADILAAFDDAIADGVDIISISLGSSLAIDMVQDSIAIGSFHAMQNGILTSHSAGNSGPGLGTTASVAPWLLSVAASSTDRRIIDKVVLGDGTTTTLVGTSVNSFDLKGEKFDLIYGKNASLRCSDDDVRLCKNGCLDANLVKGKVVVCDEVSKGEEPVHARALGTIMIDNRFNDFGRIYPLPATLLIPENGEKVKSYMNSTRNPQANILKSEAIHDSIAPVVASFSSRGPNVIIAEIIKPDISAPGVDILAAFSPLASPSGIKSDKRSVKYSIMSGTSMACPHVTGAAAYVKSFHPEWSPSAIKSALMTTAWPMNATKNELEFAYGAGHIDPVKAVNPGLVYETLKSDYIQMLCNINYDSWRIREITGERISCPEASQGSAKDLNYPSMGVMVTGEKAFKSNWTRTVTNVGSANSIYKATVTSDPKLQITVNPDVLSFQALNENKTFVVTVAGGELPDNTVYSASLVWSDGTHSVRSPIVVYTN
ncbi:PREDICTED: subtilisin-like protease SBT4.3 isoform X1 [Nelumbo nucifera]|uniref:Subtilisin-like protease SBT4.3 isoform X1 n=1 Tax=Nelumbo nucifera TaxID=4432 RepID=A0A1U8Q3V3_NELNU|nr:PREDICTED: subtilisin-like protease SBT4.3 isoform X1 [Nelumbo nucifera]